MTTALTNFETIGSEPESPSMPVHDANELTSYLPIKNSTFFDLNIFKMVIDWLEIEIHTAKPTNFWTVKRVLDRLQSSSDKKHSVTAIDPGLGGAAIQFRFRLQDPRSHRAVMELLALVNQELPLKTPPSVTAMEIALDTYQKGADLHQLAVIAADRYRWSTHLPGHAWNLYRLRGEGRIYLNTIILREVIQRLADGWQLTDTATKDANIRIHNYVKTRDAGEPLQPEDYRARFEITLSGSAMPCKTLDQLKRFDFTKLADFFKFRIFANSSPKPDLALARSWSAAQQGRRGKYRRRLKLVTGQSSGTLEYRSWTAPDGDLNAKAYSLLRKLSRSWRSKRQSSEC